MASATPPGRLPPAVNTGRAPRATKGTHMHQQGRRGEPIMSAGVETQHTGTIAARSGLLPRLYPGQGTEALHVLASAVLGVAVLVLTRGRLGAAPRSPR